jgi:hypothetical protein
VLILVRVLNADLQRYSREQTDMDTADDYGWKQVYGDVFRFPTNKNLFAAIVGVGAQFLIMIFVGLVAALLGLFNPHYHGAIISAAIFLYALTSGIAGYVSGSLFKKMGGTHWVWNIVLTASLFTLPFFLVWSVVNSVSWYNGSTQALPWTTVVVVMSIWLLIGFPLTVLGGIMGKNNKKPFETPCRTKNIPREIPILPWYASGLTQLLIGGFLPFSAISVELYYIFSSLWGRQVYTLFGILLVVFMILLVVTACITVSLTYFQLSTEDYRWWWRSICNAGSTGLFVLAYAVFFFEYRSNMGGPVQTSLFFGARLSLLPYAHNRVSYPPRSSLCAAHHHYCMSIDHCRRHCALCSPSPVSLCHPHRRVLTACARPRRRLHPPYLLHLLPHAWHCWLLVVAGICQVHVPERQNRLAADESGGMHDILYNTVKTIPYCPQSDAPDGTSSHPCTRAPACETFGGTLGRSSVPIGRHSPENGS